VGVIPARAFLMPKWRCGNAKESKTPVPSPRLSKADGRKIL
jgi:hypothetical protein